jgi:hypothetical protein
VLLALLEQQLQAQTDPQIGTPLAAQLQERLIETLRAQVGGRRIEVADSRQHDATRAAQRIGVGGHPGVEADTLERLRHAAQVARAEVEHGDAGGGGHVRVSL